MALGRDTAGIAEAHPSTAALARHALVAAHGAEGVICDDPAAATRVHSGLHEAADVRLELRILVWREGDVDL